MAKLDLYKPGWIDIVFTGRNHAYGAYDLRKNNSRSTARAMLIGGSLFILSISSSSIYKAISGFVPDLSDHLGQTEIKLAAPPPIDKKAPAPPPPEAPKAKVSEIRFPPPVVVPAEDVKNDDPPTISDLKIADIGNKTIGGEPRNDIKIEVTEVPRVSKVVEDVILPKESVQVLPQFPGGSAAWTEFMQGYNYPALARENNVSGTIYVSFVVEKDGSLTDIQVQRDGIGFGTAEEAVRLLKSSPKWKSGIQNGVPVRVAYTQPIRLSIQ